MYLYLVRHGQSVGNEKQLFFGHSDHPLTELGREQARQAADKLREVSFTRCVSSDLSRAWDTALICTEGRGVPVERDPALREQDMGALEDLTWAQAEKLCGGLVGHLLADWFHTTPPPGKAPPGCWSGWGPVWTALPPGGRTPSSPPTTAPCPWCCSTWG